MSPIAGLTNVPKAFLRLGHIRKGEKDERGFPKDLDYFRVTFNNQPASTFVSPSRTLRKYGTLTSRHTVRVV
jgi:hypothetical protein